MQKSFEVKQGQATLVVNMRVGRQLHAEGKDNWLEDFDLGQIYILLPSLIR